ncbi:hypothetical protein JFL43_22075 [Viridibacillus sp. YIM B01967]|uniref:Uncharacterized protein n=1 Tax=Viridibacillus soli TaxID=2798301 RepID=A0ABS1HDH8_9BACL|nr:hypothetical protein [Viridibacillus soli]MBK3497445.1 hypothetical protein [Viridibacillus soli]
MRMKIVTSIGLVTMGILIGTYLNLLNLGDNTDSGPKEADSYQDSRMPNVQNPGGMPPSNQDEMMPDQGDIFPPNQDEMEQDQGEMFPPNQHEMEPGQRDIPPSDQEGTESGRTGPSS